MGRGRLFALTIFLSAFLLFQVQPLMGNRILPWFGGGPAVWSTCVVFFQAALFAGYAAARLLDRVLPEKARLPAHLALIGAALLVPTAPSAPADLASPSAALFRLLAVHAGLPFLVLATTGPLVQAWFARALPGRPPYRLYALSNLGSLSALLAYPILVEPNLGLSAQTSAWTWAFRAFAVLYAAGAVGMRRVPTAAEQDAAPAPGRGDRALWILLPALVSGLLLAATNQLCLDVAVVPFLWVLPLAVYLATFILAFDHPRWARPAWAAPAAVALTFAASWLHLSHAYTPTLIVLRLSVALGVLFSVGLLCHGALARLQPAPRHLTSYYLAIAGGGALGGLFVALVAPRVFATLVEWKLGLGLGYVAAWVAIFGMLRGWARAHLNLAAGLFVVAALGLAFAAAFLSSYGERLDVARNFYGVVAVVSRSGEAGEVRDLVHGRILHGRQYFTERDRPRPTTYYVEESGMGRALSRVAARPDLRVGVVGLGVGTVAAYLRSPSQEIRFYEINPEVPRLARRWFRYLEECRGRADVVDGDARLSLASEPPRGYHVLVLDAFSGDSVPAHLLTVEAMELYARHLAPGGVVAAHVSNHFLDLGPVVRGTARRAGMTTLTVDLHRAESDAGQSSLWILCARDAADLEELSRYATPVRDSREIVWTDDRHDLFTIFRLR